MNLGNFLRRFLLNQQPTTTTTTSTQDQQVNNTDNVTSVSVAIDPRQQLVHVRHLKRGRSTMSRRATFLLPDVPAAS
ncbi:hypothetical protein INT45_005542 [Circinella minor]|uniref:Uncharacterized protein n=1 Tax=Circinella minor TaxID=1195481 RepID=A0A8H7RVD1_9FUNG|nr:hypothetical protein INT45_005542 [Circinella minor]